MIAMPRGYHTRYGISRYDYSNYQDYAMALYRAVPWDKLDVGTRRRTLKLRYPKPDFCRFCGSESVCLFELVEGWPDAAKESEFEKRYEYSCRKCHNARYHPKPPHDYIQSSATRLLKSIAASRNARDPEYKAKQKAGIEARRRSGLSRKSRGGDEYELWPA